MLHAERTREVTPEEWAKECMVKDAENSKYSDTPGEFAAWCLQRLKLNMLPRAAEPALQFEQEQAVLDAATEVWLEVNYDREIISLVIVKEPAPYVHPLWAPLEFEGDETGHYCKAASKFQNDVIYTTAKDMTGFYTAFKQLASNRPQALRLTCKTMEEAQGVCNQDDEIEHDLPF